MSGNIAPSRVETADHFLVGRDRELKALKAGLKADSSCVVHLFGVAGIGKSHLLSSLMSWAEGQSVSVLHVDCRATEPTSRGFLGALRIQLRTQARSLGKIAQRIVSGSDRTLLVLDGYEHFRLMDTWLRQEFVKALPDGVLVILAGQYRPSTGWYSQPTGKLSVLGMPLGPLDEGSSLRLLNNAGIKPEAARRIAPFTHGHPLALALAAMAIKERPGLQFESLAIQNVLEELSRMFLADVDDATTRQVLVGASVLRRITIPLLASLFPAVPAHEAYERLGALPFSETTQDGLMLHEAVRSALARSLRAKDPAACNMYRQAAWIRLSQELSGAARADLWRYTADLLYLLESPVLREAFFPTGESWLQVEPSQDHDEVEIREMIKKHHRKIAAAELVKLQEEVPGAFSVVRGEDGDCLGFYVVFDPAEVEMGILDEDPVSRAWLEHLKDNPLEDGKRAFFIRRWLSAEDGESPSEVQAACWLDIKRIYLEMRPQLQRVYLVLEDPAPFASVASQLGFSLPSELRIERDGIVLHGAVLDFGPNSVDGWLAGLLAAEIGIANALPSVDVESRELIIEGRRLPLTRLEFQVMQYLQERPGKAVSRNSLLNDVWGLNYEGGSNVVDSVIASLRKKLGEWARIIKTISGTGYSYRPPIQ